MPGILMVLAHPDDESFVGGGTLAFYARCGVPTALICLTDGQAGRLGVMGAPPLATRETLGPLRRLELERAARVLGIGEVITPGWLDGGLSEIEDRVGIERIAHEIRRLRPEVIVSFGLEGGPSAHADHILSARWTEAAFELAADPQWQDGQPAHAAKKLYWITWPSSVDSLRDRAGTPITTVIEIGPEISSLMSRAFAEHATQQDHLATHEQLLALLAGREHYHLARARVPVQLPEDDLLAGLGD